MQDSDGTLVLTHGEPTGVTAKTIKLASSAHGKACLALDLLTSPAPEVVHTWIDANGIRVLNVAGLRESGYQWIHDQAVEFFRGCLDYLNTGQQGHLWVALPSLPSKILSWTLRRRLRSVKRLSLLQ